ncbi:hypothetical protein N9293_00020 [Planctomycetota bacterium]|nr:hypothetical protein [Planctomycetota bacterium]MDB4559266.1 hypothetical protein [Planctomycetota bacterium]MDB4736259.1 hypothetical protein [Planctomycetota bacterium]
MTRSPKMMRLFATGLGTLIALAAVAGAQKPLDRSKPLTDPANDPYTRGGKQKYIEAAGYVSMGGFEFGAAPDTTKEVAALLEGIDIRWIETPHFELGIALPKVKVTKEERKKVKAELTKLQAALPVIKPDTKILDPWLRAHLYAQRLEEHYSRVQEILGVTDETFAANKEIWDIGTPYFGIGPYMGQMGKFEVLLLPSEKASTRFLTARLGLTTKLSQRWNIRDRDALCFIAHAGQGQLNVDEGMHGHAVFNVTQMMMNGYKHYSYDKPIWIREGAAHWFERNLNPRFNTFDSSEGSAAQMFKKSDWKGPTLKLVKSSDAPSFASMVKMRTFAELEKPHHLATWSIFDYLVEVHPEFLKTYLATISGIKNDQHIDDATTLPDVQRSLFRDELGMSYAQFDREWKAWVEAAY